MWFVLQSWPEDLKDLWKHVPSLLLRTSDFKFQRISRFSEVVSNFLLLRHGSIPLLNANLHHASSIRDDIAVPDNKKAPLRLSSMVTLTQGDPSVSFFVKCKRKELSLIFPALAFRRPYKVEEPSLPLPCLTVATFIAAVLEAVVRLSENTTLD
ncbi:hypothetical protein PIB30_038193 [Stylosanthes scabra]|uniref:Uncharacterized protein n=1 Tax=Stylosanthes scabra TaxID=79078 RepID=A0ABU6QDD8_9FABA|nr:hypothetical protein [Stylosanthes scabra]